MLINSAGVFDGGQLKSKVKQLDSSATIHPPIDTILDAVTFQLARLTAITERSGTYYFGKTHDVSLNQWRILGLVSALESKPLNGNLAASSNDVRSQLYMDKGQFSRTVKQLTARGLLESSVSPSDARVTDLKLTKRGRVLHDQLLSFTTERNEQAVSVLSEGECLELIRLLDKLSSHNEALQRNAGTIL